MPMLSAGAASKGRAAGSLPPSAAGAGRRAGSGVGVGAAVGVGVAIGVATTRWDATIRGDEQAAPSNRITTRVLRNLLLDQQRLVRPRHRKLRCRTTTNN